MNTSVGAIGVDLGGQNAVIAVAQKGGVEIITNEASHRETPVVVGFGKQERFIGEQGFVQLKSNFKNTIIFPNRFLGLTPDVSFLAEEQKWLYSPLVATQDNKLAFEVEYQGERKQFLPEQIVAMMLQKIKQIISKAGYSGQDMVLTVPCYYTEQERKALIDAARIAQINVIKLMNMSTATAASYGVFRRAELGTNPRNVCFIDMGHCSTGAYVGAISKDKTAILNQIQERNLGARDFDWRLLEFYVKVIQEQFGTNVMSNNKTRIRLLEAIEKQRKILSANSDATLNVDNILEDCDLSYLLTREKFEGLIAQELEKFRNMLKTLKSEIKVPLHSIEIIGGGTRTPIIQKIIQEVFGMEISRTLNGSENNARGCAMQSAMLSPVFKFAPYTIEEANYYPIRCSWSFEGSPEKMEIESEANGADKQSAIIFPKGCSQPNAKALSFRRDCNIELRVFYDDVPKGINPFIAYYLVHAQKAKNPDFSIKMRIVQNLNGLVELDSAELLEGYVEDNLAPGGNDPTKANKGDKSFLKTVAGYFSNKKEFSQQEDEVKRKDKTYSTNLNVDFVPGGFMSPQIINQLIDQENKMNIQDKLIVEAYEKKNELESYVYEFRRKLTEKYAGHIAPELKSNLLNTLDKVESWLYGEGSKTSKFEYQQKLDALKKETLPIEQKYK